MAVPDGAAGPEAVGPLSHALFLLARAHRAYAAALLRRHGLHPGQELVLMRLHEQDHQTQAALLDQAGLDHSTLSRSLTRMEAADLVRRASSVTDRRAVVVSLTAKGERLRLPLRDLWSELERATTRGIATDARDELLRSLHDIRLGLVERARDPGPPDLQRSRPGARS